MSSLETERCLRDRNKSELSKVNSISDLAALMHKFNAMQTKKFGELCEKLDTNTNVLKLKIQSLQDEMNGKICDINKNMEVLRSDFDEKLLNSESSTLKRLNELERQYRSLDLIIVGVPYIQKENVSDIFNSICTKIGLEELTPIRTAFRINPSSKSSIIIVKCSSLEQKNKILYAYIKCKQVCISDLNIGVDSIARVFINECLTKCDNIVMKKAQFLRKAGNIFKVGSRNGQVVVKWTSDSPFVKINDSDLLNFQK